MKRKLLVFLAVLVIALVPFTCFASSSTLPRVVDNADMFTASEEASITAAVKDLINETGYDFMVFTDVTTNGRTYSAYAENYYEISGYDWDGAMLFICMEEGNRGWYSAFFGDCSQYFTDDANNYVDDILEPYMQKGDYANGVVEYLDAVKDVYSGDYDKKSTPFFMIGLIAVLFGYLSGANARGKAKREMQIEKVSGASNYADWNGLNVRDKRSYYLYSNVVSTPKQKNTSNHTEHTSADRGNSVSGGGRHF